MLFALPLTFTQELDVCGINQQMKPCLAACVRHLRIQIELAPAQRAEVRGRPSKPTQVQHRLNKTCGLPQGQTKQVLERKAKLDSGIRELGLRSRLLLAAANQHMRLSSHTVKEPRALRAALYCFQLVVR